VEICFVVRHLFLQSFKIDKENDPTPDCTSPKARKRMKFAGKDLACFKIAGKSSCWKKDDEDEDITILSMDDISHSRF
jgi:hypothetical protein